MAIKDYKLENLDEVYTRLWDILKDLSFVEENERKLTSLEKIVGADVAACLYFMYEADFTKEELETWHKKVVEDEEE